MKLFGFHVPGTAEEEEVVDASATSGTAPQLSSEDAVAGGRRRGKKTRKPRKGRKGKSKRARTGRKSSHL